MSEAFDAALEEQMRIGQGAAAQGSLTALVQAYAMSVMQQPRPDFSRISNEEVRAQQGPARRALDNAANSSRKYLNVVMPESLDVLQKVENYYLTLGSFTESIKDEDDPVALAETLRDLRDEAGSLMDATKASTASMTGIVSSFNSDKQSFDECAIKINSLLDGEKGALATLQKQLDDVNASITAASVAGAVGTGAALTGAAMIIVGCCTSIFTGGLSVAVAIGGGVLLIGGLVGTGGSAIALANLHDQKRRLLDDQKQLEGTVRMMTTCGAGLADLGTQAGGAATALQNNTNSWTMLTQSLNSAANNIEKAGRAEKKSTRDRWVKTVERSAPRTLEQLKETRQAIMGMTTVSEPFTHTGDLIRSELKKSPQFAG
ncbi:HBL/NHE enterotoxin family protein [Streptomyces bacillaris]|uniref:HBL/NHE enterotoxin family protein n=1 Tax=Streptomyces bacillaris TaxID=68179 RepID=UPI0034608EFE